MIAKNLSYKTTFYCNKKCKMCRLQIFVAFGRIGTWKSLSARENPFPHVTHTCSLTPSCTSFTCRRSLYSSQNTFWQCWGPMLWFHKYIFSRKNWGQNTGNLGLKTDHKNKSNTASSYSFFFYGPPKVPRCRRSPGVVSIIILLPKKIAQVS
jgi:hypothetical protein